MNYPYTCDGMLTVECQSPIKSTLNKLQASELSVLVAKDMNAVLKVSNQSALVFCGGAFTSEQLLQPKFPVQKHITQYASAAFQGQLNEDQILSIGASDTKNNEALMPEGLQPEPSRQSLLHFPFCLYTHDLALAERFEADLMHKGMVSPPTYALLSQQLQVGINHANYMTYLDLVAMMHNHYQQLGLSHLWQVVEMALVNNDPKTAIQTETNNHFYLVDHLLFTPFFSWPQFCQYFATNDAEAYINWLMAQRLSLGAFAVHGLEIKPFKTQNWPPGDQQITKICLGEFEKNIITSSYWAQETKLQTGSLASSVIHFTHPQAGVVAVLAKVPNQPRTIYYPINPKGLTDIEQELRNQLGQGYATISREFTNEAQQLLSLNNNPSK